MSVIEKFKALSDREQRLILICGVAIIVGFFYWLIWSPINQSIEQNAQKIVAKTDLLSYVQSSAARLKGASSSQSKTFSGSLTQAVNSGASRYKISITRMQPQGEELQVWIDNVDFSQMMSWLNDLERRGVKIIVADIAESDSQGFVKVRRLQLGK